MEQEEYTAPEAEIVYFSNGRAITLSNDGGIQLPDDLWP